MRKHFILGIASFVSLASCNKVIDNKLTDGKWRGEFSVSDQKFPFIFDAVNTATDSASVYLINGAERVPLNGIHYLGDTVIVPIEAYDARLIGTVADGVFNGRFQKLFVEGGDEGIPFTAVKSEAPRFEKVVTPVSTSLAGKWDIQFVSQKGDTAYNVGIFNQNNDILTGSILTNAGDLRYLEGALTNDGFQFSAFAGLSPYLIKGKFEGNESFTGEFYTTRGVTKLIGKRNAEAALADPYSLAYMKKGFDRLDFTFPDIEGNKVSLSDPKFKDKVVIVSILGSWCPNCLDEMEYLSPWYKENKDRGVEIIGLAFERKDDPEYVKTVLSRLVKRYGTTYDILFAGKLGDDATAKALPQVSKIMGYPTTIFIDKKGKVRKIHTGFNGPATGLFYDEFKQDFNKVIDDLLAE
ncbi:TlpA family protein disulfide reductase [Dysgonomonas sp. Marseille-P4677]|uniref:TlpA disulfide reductase family protein n=1 Tax=Dysgonomonas sp. Marseille-P4677 TaxID=2364790 RepID=UPI00191466CA|nr:TlpA disulfide reductase family protein [Dysgonomonas sp. Marseille-P4677]MBK5721075.1 TlpA family protein disulfide reductase [Dysgonomonas sp. Marseille-P4677]